MTDLPPGWEWATLGEMAESVKNGIYVSRAGVEPAGVPILRISAVRPLALGVDDLRYSARTVDDLKSADAMVEGGDLLFTRYSGSRDFVGVCACAPEGLGDLTYPDKLIRVRLPPDIDPKYVAYAFTSPIVRLRVEAVLRTTAGQVGISGRELKRVTFPLAPLPEQRRIVATDPRRAPHNLGFGYNFTHGSAFPSQASRKPGSRGRFAQPRGGGLQPDR